MKLVKNIKYIIFLTTFFFLNSWKLLSQIVNIWFNNDTIVFANNYVSNNDSLTISNKIFSKRSNVILEIYTNSDSIKIYTKKTLTFIEKKKIRKNNLYRYLILNNSKDSEIFITIKFYKTNSKILIHKINIYDTYVFSTKFTNISAFNTFVIGGLFIFLVFLLSIYSYTKIKSLIYLALTNLFITLSLLTNQIHLIFKINLTEILLAKATIVFIIFALLFTYFFIKTYFENTLLTKNQNLITISNIILAIITIFIPSNYFSYLKHFSIVYVLLNLIYSSVIIIKNYKIDKIFLILTNSVIFFIYAVILYYYRYDSDLTIASLSSLLFVVINSIYINNENKKIESLKSLIEKKENIEKNIRKTIVSTPTYDILEITKKIHSLLEIEKIIIISNEKDKFYKYIVSYRNIYTFINNEEIDLNKTDEQIDNETLKEAIESKQIIEKIKSINNLPTHLIIVPILKNDNFVLLIYFENKGKKIDPIYVEIAKNINKIIGQVLETAATYYQLNLLKKDLEYKISERSKIIEIQKKQLEEIKEKTTYYISEIEEKNKKLKLLQEELNQQIEELKTIEHTLNVENEILQNLETELEKKNNLLNYNISLAANIVKLIIQNPKTSFNYEIINLPKFYIGGDFFYIKEFNDFIIYCLADCTGHAIPGALLSLFSYDLIDNLVNIAYKNNNLTSTNIILNELRIQIKKRLSYSENKEIKDGLDIAYCCIDKNTKKMYYSAAYIKILVLQQKKLIELKTQRMPVGAYISEFEKDFVTFEFQLQKGDIIYIFSDGYYDQFNDSRTEKMLFKRLQQIILEIYTRDLEEQKQLLLKKFYEWKGNSNQIDDVSALLIKIS